MAVENTTDTKPLLAIIERKEKQRVRCERKRRALGKPVGRGGARAGAGRKPNGHALVDAKLLKNRAMRLRRYGLTTETHDAIAERQGWVCAICHKKPPQVFDVDHDHKTGKVRGLLCHRCNTMLGAFGDDAELIATTMTRAISYLNASTVEKS